MVVQHGRIYANSITPVNGRLDRDGVDATDPDIVQLIVQILGATQAYQVNFTIDLLTPSIGGQSAIYIGSNTTNASGHAIFWWDANSTTYAGQYRWYGVSAVSSVNATLNASVFGGMNTTFESVLNPNATYYQNETVTTSANVTNYFGLESRDQLNASYATNATVQFQNTTGSNTSAALIYNGSQWRNTTISLLTLKGAGVWNTSIRANSTYHYANSTNCSGTLPRTRCLQPS